MPERGQRWGHFVHFLSFLFRSRCSRMAQTPPPQKPRRLRHPGSPREVGSPAFPAFLAPGDLPCLFTVYWPFAMENGSAALTYLSGNRGWPPVVWAAVLEHNSPQSGLHGGKRGGQTPSGKVPLRLSGWPCLAFQEETPQKFCPRGAALHGASGRRPVGAFQKPPQCSRGRG